MIVIFDLDGTLFQTADCVINAINLLFDELNLTRVSEQNIIENIGKRTDEFLRALLPEHVNPHDYYERFRFLEQTEVAERGKLFINVERILEQLKSNGHSLCICSNGSIEYIRLVLNTSGINNRAVERDVPKYGEKVLQKYIDKYIPLQKRYLDECKPAQIADVVVNNQNYKYPKL